MIKANFLTIFTTIVHLFFVESTTRRRSSTQNQVSTNPQPTSDFCTTEIIIVSVCTSFGFFALLGFSFYCARRRQRLQAQKFQLNQSAAVINQQSQILNMEMAGINQSSISQNGNQQQQQLLTPQYQQGKPIQQFQDYPVPQGSPISHVFPQQEAKL